MAQECRGDVYAKALGEAGLLKSEHYVESSKFGVELISSIETNPQEINIAAEAKDDYEDLGDVEDASTSIGHDDTFDVLFNEGSGLSSERITEIAQEQKQEEEQEQEMGEEEGRGAVGLVAPPKIYDKERDDHELSHTPYKSW